MVKNISTIMSPERVRDRERSAERERERESIFYDMEGTEKERMSKQTKCFIQEAIDPIEDGSAVCTSFLQPRVVQAVVVVIGF